jgi:8-amino-3,8-dideoxy-alpha-D-manno-octulosonate transaminase
MPGFERIDNNELSLVTKVFQEGGVLFAHGFEKLRKRFWVRELEEKISSYFNIKHCLLTSSGTSALKIALKSIGIQPGDEVITQSFNFIATVEAIIDCGAKPIICGCDANLHMDSDEVKKLITPKTKAIIAVHMLGTPCDMESLKEISEQKNLILIEDACESIGAKIHDKFSGTTADIGVFSFDFGKMITTGEGGCLLTNNSEIAKLAREYHDHGHMNIEGIPRGEDKARNAGFNYRMTEIQAAVGHAQLEKLSKMLEDNKARVDALINYENLMPYIREKRKYLKSNGDTLMFVGLSKQEVETIIGILKTEGIGTKNIPEAMRWHCSYFWGHCLPKEQINNSKRTKDLLDHSIAIPISLNKTEDFYSRLGLKISQSFN